VYKVAHEAIVSMHKQEYARFDALVGDCACQMRALFVACYARHYMSDKTLQKENGVVANHIATCLAAVKKSESTTGELLKTLKKKEVEAAKTTEAKQKAQRIKVADLLKNAGCERLTGLLAAEKLEVQVAPQIVMLTQALLLEATTENNDVLRDCYDCSQKVACLEQTTSYNLVPKVFQMPALSGKMIKPIIDQAKAALATASCNYMLSEAATTGMDAFDDLTQLMLRKENVRVLNRWQELPCYATLTAMFDICRQQKNPIAVLLKVKKAAHTTVQLKEPFDVQLYLKPLQPGGGFVAVKPTKEELDDPVIVVEAQRGGKAIATETTADYVARLKKCNLMSIIRVTGAAHRQYTNDAVGVPSLEAIAKSGEEMPLLARFNDLQKRAKEVGCCLESQTTLRMYHIFSSTLKMQKAVITE